MNALDALQADLDRWQAELATLTAEGEAEGWTEPEKLLFTIQWTAATYRRRMLPRLAAERDLLLPAMSDSEALDALSAYTTIIGDELAALVDQLDDIRRDLIGGQASKRQQDRATEILAAIRALATVVLRFGHEVELPRLAARLTPEQSGQLTEAVHAYESSLR